MYTQPKLNTANLNFNITLYPLVSTYPQNFIVKRLLVRCGCAEALFPALTPGAICGNSAAKDTEQECHKAKSQGHFVC